MRPALPAWTRTVRARLAFTYSGLVFGIAAVVLIVVYLGLAAGLEAEPLDSVALQKFKVSDDGWVKFLDGASAANGSLVSAADLDIVQRAVNERTLQSLRVWTSISLGGLFLFSLLVGWWVSGRVLRPLGAITTTTREITATDLSRRIGSGGPPDRPHRPEDELTTLARTIDEMLDRLEGAFDAQRALLDDVSHELRNPVAVIRTNVDAVLSDEGASPADRRRATTVVSRAADEMAVLIEDLLATARRRSGAFDETDLALPSLAGTVADEYGPMLQDRGLVLHRRLADGPVVYGDRSTLVRAIRNLLANAIRFTPDGGSLDIVTGSVRGWAFVAVRDSGPGIPEDRRGRVFDRYFSAPAEQNGQPARERNGNGGTGIGLAIARQVVEAHGGTLAVHSSPGAGATFVIWLPDRAVRRSTDRDTLPPDTDPLA
ncbi:HAMP domain-containing protein [Nakamurella sp. YIM 132087]|uniref:histidine kinase n=1 Tax=Nakamurella alba TaxID=2665158 RepID=A0A7K1FIF2_9ACTN|nr:HAMP domain-containing sensor histidine kinase [Nakamurella alba]MTD13229.1 HAMP domain-containing protein [Nakamurella alba]